MGTTGIATPAKLRYQKMKVQKTYPLIWDNKYQKLIEFGMTNAPLKKYIEVPMSYPITHCPKCGCVHLERKPCPVCKDKK